MYLLSIHNYLKNGLVLLLLLLPAKVWCQAPVASFNATAAACMQETIPLQNNSTNANSFEWDFCADDFFSLKSSAGLGLLSSLKSGEGFKLIGDNGLWYGFAASRDNNKLLRFDFGDSPENVPTIIDLGNPGGLLHSPEGLDIIKANGNWYIFIGTLDFVAPTSGIIKIELGNSLTNSPSATDLGSFNLNSRIRNVGVVQQGSDLILILVGYNLNTITRINYRNSFDNSISAGDISDVGFIANLPIGLNILQKGTNWIVHVSSLTSNTISQLNFGSDILSIPTLEGTYAFTGVVNPDKMKLIREGNQYFAVVSNSSQAFTVVNFKDLNPASVPSEIVTSNLPGILGVDVARWMGRNVVLGLGNVTNEIKKTIFESDCGANVLYSTSTAPSLVYSSSGIKQIELVARQSSSGSSSLFSTSVSVSALTSPDISISTAGGVCTSQSISFIPASIAGSITTYAWDFGDNATSSSNNPVHSYLTASTYYPSLTVTASNGCQNFTQSSLQIFNPPQAGFSIPLISPLCTNQNYTFANSSTFDSGSNPTWQWSVNGSNVSATQDLNYLFTSSATQSVTLTASIPGCSTQSTQNITSLVDGPLISFTSSSIGCQGSTIPFVNTTTDPVANFSWSFGDGNTSVQNSPSNTYSSFGNYAVSLSGTNASGCQNSFSKNISIYSIPQTDFAIEAPPLSCANTPSKFDNLTAPLTDSNVSLWSWSFGDANSGSSNQKNPSYLYSLAGNYNVSLQATTNFGCSKSIQKQITIFPSPQAGFTNSAACVNQSTHFSDASSGSISLYQWNVQNIVLSGAAPSYVFKSSGSFPVTLTVTGSNGCLNQTTKSIMVPVMPVVDFSVSAPCTGHPTHFQEVNFGGVDPAIAWNWNFGQSSGTGSPASYQFPSEGGFTVIMNTTRQSGCVYSISKNISISTGPTASFTPSVFAGAAPLDVTFNNTSTADSYVWQFDDANQTTSTNTSPEFVYPLLGKYKVLLTAYNNLGCSDTLSTEIDVVVPHIDIVMNNLSLTNDPNSNSSKAVVTILNSGNIPLVDPEVLIDFGGNASVKEKISGLVRPGKSIVQTLGLQIVPRSLQYICAEIDVPDDVNSGNNKQCVSLSSEDVVMTPYPNPSTAGQVTIEWVGAVQENAVITIFRSNGEIAFEQKMDEVNVGLGQLTINTSSFSNGLYLVQFSGSKTKKTFRIMIAN